MTELLAVCRTFLSIQKFISGGELATVLDEIGTSELNAAIRIANDIDQEANPVNTVNRILVHLESAYEVLATHKDSILLVMYGSKKKIKGINTKINKICIISAICHKFIGSSDKLISKWLIENSTINPDKSDEVIDKEYLNLLITDKNYRRDCMKMYDRKLYLETDTVDVGINEFMLPYSP